MNIQEDLATYRGELTKCKQKQVQLIRLELQLMGAIAALEGLQKDDVPEAVAARNGAVYGD